MCKWANCVPVQSRTQECNIVTHLLGVIGEVRIKKQYFLNIRYLIFDNGILKIVFVKTNEKNHRVK